MTARKGARKKRGSSRWRERRPLARRWHLPKPRGQTVAPKEYITAADLRVLLTESLGNKLHQQFSLRLADARYFCPPLADAKEIIAASLLDRKTWAEERFDCDDFAHVLKAHFAEAAYKNGTRRAAHCFGVVWGSLPGPHAINWMVNADRKLRFVEPQSDAIFRPRATDRNIYFMLV